MGVNHSSVASFTGNSCATALRMAAQGHFSNVGVSPQTLIEQSMEAIRDLAGTNNSIQHNRGASLPDGGAPLVRNERPAEISGGITA